MMPLSAEEEKTGVALGAVALALTDATSGDSGEPQLAKHIPLAPTALPAGLLTELLEAVLEALDPGLGLSSRTFLLRVSPFARAGLVGLGVVAFKFAGAALLGVLVFVRFALP